MGHLINAKSMRLGWFKHWWDIWSVKQIYYTSLLYSCFRIRYFLIYLFFSKFTMIKLVMFFGHFHIEKVYKFLLIKLYYYDALLEEAIDDNYDMIRENFNEYMRSRKYIRKYQSTRKMHIGTRPRVFITPEYREAYNQWERARKKTIFLYFPKRYQEDAKKFFFFELMCANKADRVKNEEFQRNFFKFVDKFTMIYYTEYFTKLLLLMLIFLKRSRIRFIRKVVALEKNAYTAEFDWASNYRGRKKFLNREYIFRLDKFKQSGKVRINMPYRRTRKVFIPSALVNTFLEKMLISFRDEIDQTYRELKSGFKYYWRDFDEFRSWKNRLRKRKTFLNFQRNSLDRWQKTREDVIVANKRLYKILYRDHTQVYSRTRLKKRIRVKLLEGMKKKYRLKLDIALRNDILRQRYARYGQSEWIFSKKFRFLDYKRRTHLEYYERPKDAIRDDSVYHSSRYLLNRRLIKSGRYRYYLFTLIIYILVSNLPLTLVGPKIPPRPLTRRQKWIKSIQDFTREGDLMLERMRVEFRLAKIEQMKQKLRESPDNNYSESEIEDFWKAEIASYQPVEKNTQSRVNYFRILNYLGRTNKHLHCVVVKKGFKDFRVKIASLNSLFVHLRKRLLAKLRGNKYLFHKRHQKFYEISESKLINSIRSYLNLLKTLSGYECNFEYMNIYKENYNQLNERFEEELIEKRDLTDLHFSTRIVNMIFKALYKCKMYILAQFFTTSHYRKNFRKQSLSLLLVFCLLHAWYHKVPRRLLKSWDVLRSLFTTIHIHGETLTYNEQIGDHLKHFIQPLSVIQNFEIEFYLVQNETVSATFLARYIANKFKQNLSIRSVLNPLKREFRRVSREFTYPSVLRRSRRTNGTLFFEKKRAIKYVWKKIISLGLLTYNDYYLMSSHKNQSWFFIDTIPFYKLFYKDVAESDSEAVVIPKKVSRRKEELNRKKELERRKTYCTYFVRRKNIFFLKFMSRLGQCAQGLSKYCLVSNHFDQKIHIYRSIENSTDRYIKDITDFILWNIGISKSFFIVDSNNILSNYRWKAVSALAGSYKRYLRFTYWRLNYRICTEVFPFNYLRARAARNAYSTTNYLGFKISCSGRFSRRQRATRYSLLIGTVPLTQLNADIDYGNYIVPIKNSAISIKVWVHLARPLEYILM